MNNIADKQTMQTKQLIFHTLLEIMEQFPQYTVAKHLYFILRRKGDPEEIYYWSDQKILKKFEDYKDELERELANKVTDQDDE